ncbi:MAG: M20 family peptidase [Pseudomonadales bacterium]|nr:M20 family peptidase [Pseudomonadales bacterium]
MVKISGTLAAVVVVIVLVNTFRHTPDTLRQVAPVEVTVDEDLIARHLAEAVQFRTVSHQDPSLREQDQFEGFIAWVKSTYPEVNENLALTRLNDTLLYRWEGADGALQPILITGHYDVVPVIPGTEERWEQPPFSGNIVDGVIWGRGTLDDKSGVVGILEATTLLLQQGFQPQRTVYLSFGHDEEIGGPNGAGEVARFLKENQVQLAWSLDEGSFVFDDMLPGVEPLVAIINVAEKGSVTLDIVATAAGGHSSMPPAETAVGKLARALVKLEENPVPGGLEGLSASMFDTTSRYMPFLMRMMFANQWLFGAVLEKELAKMPAVNAMLRTTTAPTMLSGSVKTNVLPIEAVARVNFRIHPRDSVQDVADHVARVVQAPDVEVRLPATGGLPASVVSDWNSEGFGVIGDSVLETYGSIVVTPGLMVAGSDTRHYGKVADNAFRFNPLVVTQADLTGFHGTNEKISVANMAQGVRSYARIISNGAGKADAP